MLATENTPDGMCAISSFVNQRFSKRVVGRGFLNPAPAYVYFLGLRKLLLKETACDCWPEIAQDHVLVSMVQKYVDLYKAHLASRMCRAKQNNTHHTFAHAMRVQLHFRTMYKVSSLEHFVLRASRSL